MFRIDFLQSKNLEEGGIVGQEVNTVSGLLQLCFSAFPFIPHTPVGPQALSWRARMGVREQPVNEDSQPLVHSLLFWLTPLFPGVGLGEVCPGFSDKREPDMSFKGWMDFGKEGK